MPPTKNLTFPATLIVTVIVVLMPLLIVPETVGALIEADSLALVMVIVTVWVSVKDPSERVTMTIYALLVSASAGASKSGFAAKASAPEDELIEKSAASVPEIDQVRVVPVSTSLPAYVTTEVMFSAWEMV